MLASWDSGQASLVYSFLAGAAALLSVLTKFVIDLRRNGKEVKAVTADVQSTIGSKSHSGAATVDEKLDSILQRVDRIGHDQANMSLKFDAHLQTHDV